MFMPRTGELEKNSFGISFLGRIETMCLRYALLVVVLFSAEQVLSQEAKEFAPRNGMFTITMPSGVKSGDRKQILKIKGHKVALEGSQSVLKDGTSFHGSSIGIPAVVMREIPANQRFDLFRDALVKSRKGKVVEEKDIKQDPVVGKEYQIELPKGGRRACNSTRSPGSLSLALSKEIPRKR
jgi:hypothetical protein